LSQGASTIGRQIERFYRIPKEKISVVYNWVEPKQFSYDETSRHVVRKELGVLEDDVVFLLLGALSRKKGFRVALDSFEVLIKTVPNAYLFIAGEGPDILYFENHIRHSKKLYSSEYNCWGFIPMKNCPSLFSSAVYFHHPFVNERSPSLHSA